MVKCSGYHPVSKSQFSQQMARHIAHMSTIDILINIVADACYIN